MGVFLGVLHWLFWVAPNDLFQKPAAEIPNIINAVRSINGIFRLLHSTLCSMNNGNALETAMGVGEGDDKFIAPGANIRYKDDLDIYAACPLVGWPGPLRTRSLTTQRRARE